MTPKISVGDLHSCTQKPGPVVVHACKYPCFNVMSGGESDILTIDQGDHLYLNVVDADRVEYVHLVPFQATIKFLNRHKDRDVLIHCNKGMSRSPALAMTWLSWLHGLSLDEARLLVGGKLGSGMEEFLHRNWRKLRDFQV